MKNEPNILFWAFRYALGRASYAVSDVVNAIIVDWDGIDLNTQNLIQQEISRAIEDKRAGMDMDVVEWKKILKLKTK